MRPPEKPRRPLVSHSLWFIVSMLLAFLVWFVATLESDPVGTRVFSEIEIQVDHDESLVIVEQTTDAVTVNVRAPESILENLRRDDIQVVATVPEASPGEYGITLAASVARRAIPDPVPRRVVVTLEEAQDKLVPVIWEISEPPPLGFEIADNRPELSTNQVLISGPKSQVEQVVNAQIILNLSQRRNPFTDDLRVLAVDANGDVVNGVRSEPANVQVNVDIQTRSDIRQISVTPNVLTETLAPGYSLTSIEYEPRILLVNGPREALANAPGSWFTAPIDLTDRTATFEETITIQRPSDELIVLGSQTIQVTVNIEPLLGTRQIEGVPVEVIGLSEANAAEILPTEVTVLLTGPQSLLETLSPQDIRVVTDLNGLEIGNYQLAPVVSVSVDESLLTNVAVLPADIDVTIRPTIGGGAAG